jgi:hypothetical protein
MNGCFRDVFEQGKKEKIETDSYPKTRRSWVLLQPFAECKIDYDREDENGREPSRPSEVKRVARDEKNRLPDRGRAQLRERDHAEQEHH